MSKHIYIKEMIKQSDGGWTIILGDGRVITNLGVCCNAQEVEMEDSFFYEIYFEKVKL
jgi:5'(3')-deoxyribonucleotidase